MDIFQKISLNTFLIHYLNKSQRNNSGIYNSEDLLNTLNIIKKVNYDFMKKFRKMITIGKEELNAASKVIKSGQLSYFLGERSKDFLEVKKLKNLKKILKIFIK